MTKKVAKKKAKRATKKSTKRKVPNVVPVEHAVTQQVLVETKPNRWELFELGQSVAARKHLIAMAQVVADAASDGFEFMIGTSPLEMRNVALYEVDRTDGKDGEEKDTSEKDKHDKA